MAFYFILLFLSVSFPAFVQTVSSTTFDQCRTVDPDLVPRLNLKVISDPFFGDPFFQEYYQSTDKGSLKASIMGGINLALAYNVEEIAKDGGNIILEFQLKGGNAAIHYWLNIGSSCQVSINFNYDNVATISAYEATSHSLPSDSVIKTSISDQCQMIAPDDILALDLKLVTAAFTGDDFFQEYWLKTIRGSEFKASILDRGSGEQDDIHLVLRYIAEKRYKKIHSVVFAFTVGQEDSAGGSNIIHYWLDVDATCQGRINVRYDQITSVKVYLPADQYDGASVFQI